MLRILRRIKGFKIEANHLVVACEDRYYLDFFIPAALLGIECHSFRWHIGKHNEDARRDRRIRSSGIELLFFTWDDAFFGERDVEREIRDAIGGAWANSSTQMTSQVESEERNGSYFSSNRR